MSMLITLTQMALAVFQNVVPAGGVVFRGWTPATALTLYWCENLVAIVLIAIRIVVHRRLTRKNGHFTLVKDLKRPGQPPTKSTFLAGFLVVSLGFTLVHGVFLAAVLAIIVKVEPDVSQVVEGLKWMVSAQVLGLLLDLIRIRNWPFGEVRKMSDSLMGRVLLIQFSILGGMLFAAISSRPMAIFAVFGILKTLADVLSRIPYNPQPTEKAPGWFLKMAGFFDRARIGKPGEDPAEWWRETHLKERQIAEDDEKVAPVSRG